MFWKEKHASLQTRKRRRADEGDWEVKEDDGGHLSVFTYNEGGYCMESVRLDEVLRALTDDQREKLFREFLREG